MRSLVRVSVSLVVIVVGLVFLVPDDPRTTLLGLVGGLLAGCLYMLAGARLRSTASPWITVAFGIPWLLIFGVAISRGAVINDIAGAFIAGTALAVGGVLLVGKGPGVRPKQAHDEDSGQVAE